MSRLVAPTERIKPARWNATLGMVAPEWQWAWRSLESVVVLNEAGGPPFDLAIRETTTFVGAPTWASSLYGAMLDFDGSDDEVELNADRLNFSTSRFAQGFTVAMLLRSRSSLGDHRTAFVSANGSGGTAWQVHISHMTNGNLRGDIRSGGTSPVLESAINTDQWYFAVLTWDGADGRWYVDGILRDGPSAIGQPDNDPGGRKTVLGDFHASSSLINWDGDIALSVVWSRALSDGDITALARDPFGPFRMGRRRVSVAAPAAPGVPVHGLATLGVGR